MEVEFKEVEDHMYKKMDWGEPEEPKMKSNPPPQQDD